MTNFFAGFRNSRTAAFAATAVVAAVLILLPFLFGQLGNAWVRAWRSRCCT